MGSSDDESEVVIEPVEEASLGQLALDLWNSRSKKLHHDYAIAGWALSVSKEVRDHVSQNMLPEHREAIERVVRCLHVVPCPNKDPKVVGADIDEVVDLFWDEFKCFEKKTKPFDNVARWNTQNAVTHICGMKNTHCLLGFVTCHVTSKTLGIGPCERNWASVKNIKTGKRVNLGGESLEKRSVLYATALINDVRLSRKENENIESSGQNALFCNNDVK